MSLRMRSGFEGDNDVFSLNSGIDFTREVVDPKTGEVTRVKEESRAIQSQKDDADINVLVKRFGIGEDSHWPQKVRVPLQEDFIDVQDFQSAQNAVIEAGNSFRSLPAAIRARFGNDPREFVEFCINPENIGEMRKLGLAVPAAAGSVDESGAGANASGTGGAPS